MANSDPWGPEASRIYMYTISSLHSGFTVMFHVACCMRARAPSTLATARLMSASSGLGGYRQELGGVLISPIAEARSVEPKGGPGGAAPGKVWQSNGYNAKLPYGFRKYESCSWFFLLQDRHIFNGCRKDLAIWPVSFLLPLLSEAEVARLLN